MTPPGFVYDGQTVWAPAPLPDGTNPTGRAVKCVVTIAAGHHARVKSVSAAYPLDRWIDIGELRIRRVEPAPA